MKERDTARRRREAAIESGNRHRNSQSQKSREPNPAHDRTAFALSLSLSWGSEKGQGNSKERKESAHRKKITRIDFRTCICLLFCAWFSPKSVHMRARKKNKKNTFPQKVTIKKAGRHDRRHGAM